MVQNCVIGRTERVSALKELLEEKQVLYLSAFFCAGKTVLLDQLAQALKKPVLRFNMGEDDWNAFAAQVQTKPECVLLIDSLHLLDESTEQALSALIAHLKPGQSAVLAGRAQLPTHLHQLCATGVVTMLDKDFVLLDEAEIIQLFLAYGVTLRQDDAAWLKDVSWGWPVVLHVTAQEAVKRPDRPLRDMRSEVAKGLWSLLIQKVVMAFTEPERALLLNLSPFISFTEDMARMVTGRNDAPRMLDDIAQKSYMLLREKDDRYAFIPFVRNALFDELKRGHTDNYINNQYRRAALYYELRGDIPQAVNLYMMLRDTDKIRELLIRDSAMRPSNGDYAALKPAYDMLSEQDITASPNLLKGMCLIESLRGHVAESERWYDELESMIENTSPADARHRTAQEAVAYLDIGLAHRGTKNILKTLVATAKLKYFTDSASWRSGFNVAGNSVSLMNGGKDFSRWNPHGQSIYRLFKGPVEMALGRGGSGMADIAIGECLLESSLNGDYTEAWTKVRTGLARATEDLEMQCAATGIQARIVMAQGDISGASDMLKKRLESLPQGASVRLKQNLECAWLTMELMQEHTGDALNWLSASAPDETGEFNILDRYRYMLKLRLYIITGAWVKTRLLTNLMADYCERYERPYLRIQLYLLEALIDRRTDKETWQDRLTRALQLAKHYRLARVIADEGIAALDMLCDLKLPDGGWEQGVLRLTRAQAAMCPNYMNSVAKQPTLTDREYQVYSLLTAGYSNPRIAKLLNITERAVKYHVTEIYRKLGVKSRSEALMKASELGDI